MTITLLRHQRRELALQLLQRRLRTTPIYFLTGLPELEIRDLYRLLFDQRPPSGPLPNSGTILSTRHAQARVSVFAAIYLRLGGTEARRKVDAEVLMKSYDLFLELSPAEQVSGAGSRFDFTDAWAIARDLRSGMARLKSCRPCRTPYLVAFNADLPPNCPFCALRKDRKRRQNPPTA